MECGQEGLLTRRRFLVRYSGDARSEVLQLVHDIPRRYQLTGQLDKIEPLVRRTLDGSVVQVEAVDVDSDLQGYSLK